MANMRAKALAKRKPAQMDEMTDEQIKQMVDEDRMEDPNQKKDVNANTDDQGNDIAKKEAIYMAKTKSKQMESDQAQYEQKTALPKRIREAALAAKRKNK